MVTEIHQVQLDLDTDSFFLQLEDLVDFDGSTPIYMLRHDIKCEGTIFVAFTPFTWLDVETMYEEDEFVEDE